MSAGAMTHTGPRTERPDVREQDRRAVELFIDYLVHAWDVGASIGVDVRPDDTLLEPALDVTRAVPAGDVRTRPGAAFAPVLDGVSAEPDPWRRVLRMLGRDPDWRAPVTS